MGAAITTGFGKRLDGVTGRRSASRVEVHLPTALTTTKTSDLAELLNISPTGALLGGRALPRAGTDLLLDFEGVEAFGTVVWVQDRLCGVHFDEPMSLGDLKRLEFDGSDCLRAHMTPDERLATEAWVTGFAR